MLDSLKQAGKNIGRELNRAWESLSDGWRELLSRCSNALVHYERDDYPDQEIAFPIGASWPWNWKKRLPS